MFDFMMDDFSQSHDSTPTGPIVPSPMECMSCGLCLNNCPTYQLSKDEKEGPRSRIRTLSKLIIEETHVDEESIKHLNNCLQCGACELVCPSQMSFSELFDKAQHQLAQEKPKSFYAKFALNLIADKTKRKRLLPILSLYHLSGVRYLAQKTGLLKLLKLDTAEQMARIPHMQPLKNIYPVANKSKGKVALFTGCITEDFDRTTLDAAIQVLNALDYDVCIPKQQACCGAIHYHNGDLETAKQLMQQNRDCFNQESVEAIIYCATGCGSQLQAYALALDLKEEQAFKAAVFEITEFIAQHWNDSVQLKPCTKKIAVHEPCSQRNVLNNQQAVYDVLAKIPALQVVSLEDHHVCCGAGGTYMLTHPQTAQSLRDKKWQQIQDSQADGVVSSNIGCVLHLQTFDAKAFKPEFKHPVRLLAEQLLKH